MTLRLFAHGRGGPARQHRAATHWHYAAELAARYPAVKIDADVLWVDEGAGKARGVVT